MKPVKLAKTVSKGDEDITGTVVEWNYDITNKKLHPLLRSVVRTTPDTRNEIPHALADIRVSMKTNIEKIVQNLQTKRISTQQTQILMPAVYTLEESFQASYSVMNNCLEFPVFKEVEKCLARWFNPVISLQCLRLRSAASSEPNL